MDISDISFEIKSSPTSFPVNCSYPYFQVFVSQIRWVSQIMPEVKYIQSLPTIKGKIVYVLNVGLHYDSNPLYKTSLTQLMKALQELNSTTNHIVLFRETSAQHFNTSTGAYSRAMSGDWAGFSDERRKKARKVLSTTSPVKEIVRMASGDHSHVNLSFASQQNISSAFKYIFDDHIRHRCVPLKSIEQLKLQNWRNDIVYDVLRELDLTEAVGVIPFFNITAARHDHHVNKGVRESSTTTTSSVTRSVSLIHQSGSFREIVHTFAMA